MFTKKKKEMIGDISAFPPCTVYKPYALFHPSPLSLALSEFILQASQWSYRIFPQI